MVRILLTGASRLDPALAAAGPASARRALEALDGVLAIEVDGVDLTGGRAEGPLLPALESLLLALARVQAGAPLAAAHLRQGDLLLLLRGFGHQVRLSLVDLGPPGRLVVRELELELAGLTAAALTAAAGLCRTVSESREAGAEASRRLRAAARPPRLAAHPTGLAPSASASQAAPAALAGAAGGHPVRCEVTLDEEARPPAGAGPGGLAGLLVPGAVRLAVLERALLLEGLPFLTLRDLVDGLAEVARAEHRGDRTAAIRLGRTGRAADAVLLFDLAAGALTLGGGPPLPATPLDVARAAEAAVAWLDGRLGGGSDPDPALEGLRAASAAAVAHLAERTLGDALLTPAPAPAPRPAPAPSQAPLGPGDLRRVALRVAWRDHVGPPVGPGLTRLGAVLVATGEEAVVGRSGGRTWRAPGADWAAEAAGLLLVRRGDLLSALEPGTGLARWTRHLDEAHPTGAAGRRGGALLVGEAGALSALDPRDGRPRWRLELPGGHGLALAAFGPLLAAGTGGGLVYGVDLTGQVAWRVRAPGPALAPPLLVGRALASLHAAGPGASLLFLEPATGQRLAEVALDVVPAGGPQRWSGGLALAGRSGGAAVVTLVRPGGRAWTVEAALLGTPRLAVAGRRLLVADAHGAVACLEPSGRVAWSLPAAGAAEGAVPLALRGVVLAARDGLTLLDLASGRRLGAVEGLHPARLLATHDLAVAALEADGGLCGLSSAGHLSLLRGRREGR